MTIREYKIEDSEQIKDLAMKYNLNLPADGKIIVAESSLGKIVGFVCVRLVPMITPFVSENSLMGKQLFDYIENKLKEKNYPLIQCYVEEKNRGLLEKLGFCRIFPKHLIMEKLFL